MKTRPGRKYLVVRSLFRRGWSVVSIVDGLPDREMVWLFDTRSIAEGVARVLRWHALPGRLRKGVRP